VFSFAGLCVVCVFCVWFKCVFLCVDSFWRGFLWCVIIQKWCFFVLLCGVCGLCVYENECVLCM